MDCSELTFGRKSVRRTRRSIYFYHVEKKTIHIGKIIRDKMEELRIRPADLIRDMKMNKQTFYNHLNRPSMDTDMLQRFSEALNHNFFSTYITSEEFMQLKEPEVEYVKASEVNKLRQQLNNCLQEKNDLKDIIIDLQKNMLKKPNHHDFTKANQ